MVGAVVRAGGVPVVLPVVSAELAAAQLEGADGLVLSGGHDLALPLRGVPDEGRWIDPDRDDHETALWHAAEAGAVPVLGICRGAQLVSHVRGGTLVEHVEGHDASSSHAEAPHRVTVVEGTLLAGATGPGALSVNTIHHQAVAEPGAGLRISARADDGVIEGIETADGSHWFLGVQWHPELMPGSTAGGGLFEALVSAAST